MVSNGKKGYDIGNGFQDYKNSNIKYNPVFVLLDMGNSSLPPPGLGSG